MEDVRRPRNGSAEAVCGRSQGGGGLDLFSSGAQAEAGGGWTEAEKKKKKAAVEAEVERMNKLPPSSAYATHRLRVLNKIMHLLSLRPQLRTQSETEELEVLFSGLNL